MTQTGVTSAHRQSAIVIVVVLIAVGVAVSAIVSRGQAQEETAPVTRGVPVRSFEIRASTLDSGRDLVASGTLVPIRQSTLGFVVGGVVERVTADEGNRLEAGTALASLDATPFRAAVDQSEARLRFLESRWTRSGQLATSGAIAHEEFDADASEREGAVAAVKLARWNFSRSVVRAPFSGSIAKRLVEVGEVVAPGTPAFELIATDSLKLSVAVPARDLFRIGGEAVVSSADFPGLVFPARVDHRPVTADPRSSSVPITLHLENPEFKLLPGTIARVRFPMAERDAAVLSRPSGQVRVPLSAIRTTGAGPIVFRIVDRHARGVAVQLGDVREDYVWVRSELQPGTEVVLEAPDRLRDGDLLIVAREG